MFKSVLSRFFICLVGGGLVAAVMSVALNQSSAQCISDILDGVGAVGIPGAGLGAAIGFISPDPVTTIGGAAVGGGIGGAVVGTAGGFASDACRSIL